MLVVFTVVVGNAEKKVSMSPDEWYGSRSGSFQKEDGLLVFIVPDEKMGLDDFFLKAREPLVAEPALNQVWSRRNLHEDLVKGFTFHRPRPLLPRSRR